MNVMQSLRHSRYRLCSFILNKHYFNNRINNHLCVKQQQRHFSLQSTIDSIAKTQTGIFKSLSESTPVEYCQKFLLNVHDTTGLPWWATIICTTIMMRGCVTVPLAIYQNYIMAKLEFVKLEMDGIAKELKRETAIAVKMYNWDERTARITFKRSIRKQWQGLIQRENCHPFKSTLLIFFQIPLWISLSVSLRNLVYMLPHQDTNAQITFTELSVGGFGWIPNLTVADSSLVLPVSFGLLNLAIIEMQTLSKINVPTKLQRYLTNFFRGLSLMMIPIASVVPSCVVLYWTTSSAFGFVQNLILISPKIRRMCKIPQTPSEIEQPYQHILLGFKQKCKNLSGFKT
ncbi:cytochrome c oxidase assembly protein COX18, mitochondrial isoform X1 [Tribolium madens]|uniref:cytochrome c oxidase assembly protein COX18, mitochondrial isoform X1 n=2 Tax=Tribolium madens TaxID=41895 RepID=UPI001CF765FB|nr:cytochrome c oxidase assembly protein COX18, mitochondrial isoform X1 [Tribolium madens]